MKIEKEGWLTLENNTVIFIDPKLCRCKFCDKQIYWGVTKKNQKRIPIDKNLKTTHFESCVI